MNYYSHTCLCGCGGQIEIKEYHEKKGIPKYIHNHHRRGIKNKKSSTKKAHIKQRYKIAKYLKQNRNKHFCQCGCNQRIRIKFRKNRKSRYLGISIKYINGHQSKIINNDINTKKKHYEITKQLWASPIYREKILKNNPSLQKGKPKSEEHKKKIGQGNKGKIHSEEQNEVMSKTIKGYWQNPEFVKKQKEARNLFPNKAELYLQNIINSIANSFLYVGDFSCFIGGRCPDFIDKTNNKIIELYGDYWHKGQDPNDRINYFKQYGYDTLVVWESELKNINELKNKLEVFLP